MSYLTKEQYSRRNENASKRMTENSKINTLTEEQHEALSNLCKVRHELHANMDSCTRCADNDYKQNIILANVQLHESGIDTIDGIGIDSSDYIDIDAIDEAMEYECVSVDDDNYQEWYDDTYTRLYKELESINKDIEIYLEKIDSIYGTNYAPTGAQRII